jgi:hypothetical protein
VLIRKLLLLAVLIHGFQVAQAQSTRADAAARTSAASRTAAALDRAQAAPEVAGISLVQAEADLGTQELIRERPSQLGAYLIGNAGLFYTSNPSLSNEGGRGDCVWRFASVSIGSPRCVGRPVACLRAISSRSAWLRKGLKPPASPSSDVAKSNLRLIVLTGGIFRAPFGMSTVWPGRRVTRMEGLSVK